MDLTPPKPTISNYYEDQLRRMHQADPSWGRDGAKWATHILDIIWAGRTKTLLDYGAGKGELKVLIDATPALSFLRVAEYDPGIAEKATPPAGAFDLVVCTDVMEHIEGAYVGAVIEQIARYTLNDAFFVINTRPARATLPDGRNAHLTIKPSDWWLGALSTHFRPVHHHVTHKEFVFHGKRHA